MTGKVIGMALGFRGIGPILLTDLDLLHLSYHLDLLFFFRCFLAVLLQLHTERLLLILLHNFHPGDGSGLYLFVIFSEDSPAGRLMVESGGRRLVPDHDLSAGWGMLF